MKSKVVVLIGALFALHDVAAFAASPVGDPEIARIVKSVCTKDVVLLGELPSHGEARAFELKARVARVLVETCGFNAVLFEAPIYDFVGLQNALHAGNAQPVMLDNAIGRFWLNRDLQPFRSWLFAQAKAKRVSVGGIDDQISVTSKYAQQRLPELVAPECKAIVKRNLEYTYTDAQPFDDAEKQRLQQCTVTNSNDVLLQNFKTYVARQIDPAKARPRDEVLYDNLRWYQSQLPRNSKIIVWTATVHAARKQGDRPDPPLGVFLADSMGQRVAAIGFTALAGESSMAGNPAKRLLDLPANSLEAQALARDVAWTFLDHAQLERLDNTSSRLLGKIVSAKWSDYFDGVVVIREETAPMRAQGNRKPAASWYAGVLFGSWSIGSGLWPFGLVSGEYEMRPGFFLGMSGGAVSRPVILCGKGLNEPMCDEKKVIRMLTADARYEFGSRSIRPYFGGSAGRTWYFNTGRLIALHGGLIVAASSSVKFRADAALHVYMEGDGPGGATSLQGGLLVNL